MQSEIYPTLYLRDKTKSVIVFISHEFSTFHAKRGPLQTTRCLWNETKSIIVLFHMEFLQYNYRPRFIPMQRECGMALASRGKSKTEYRTIQL